METSVNPRWVRDQGCDIVTLTKSVDNPTQMDVSDGAVNERDASHARTFIDACEWAESDSQTTAQGNFEPQATDVHSETLANRRLRR